MLGLIHCTQVVGAALLLAVIVFGALIVIKNFPYVHFSDGLIIGVDLFQIGMAMALLVMNQLCLTKKKRWTVST